MNEITNINPNLSQSEKKIKESKQLLASSFNPTYTKYFDKITELQAGDVIVNLQCKFCNHPLRAEAEAAWEKSKGRSGRGSYTMVLKVLNDNSEEYGGTKFNSQNVSVHINHHYEQQMKRMWMREYGRHLADVINHRISKDEMLEGMIQALQLKLYEVASDPELDPGKQADIMAKLAKSVIDTSIAQAKLRGDVDSLDVYKEKVHNVMVNFIAAGSDVADRLNLLEKLDLAKAELSENQ